MIPIPPETLDWAIKTIATYDGKTHRDYFEQTLKTMSAEELVRRHWEAAILKIEEIAGEYCEVTALDASFHINCKWLGFSGTYIVDGLQAYETRRGIVHELVPGEQVGKQEYWGHR